MDREEAKHIQSCKIEELRKRTYAQLCHLLEKENVETEEVVGASGKSYQLEAYAVWDDQPGKNLRVFVCIDDGSFWRSIHPLSDDFIVAPDGSFVGE